MLRRFASKPPPDRKSNQNRRKRPVGNEVVTAVDLIRDPPEISTFPVKRIFGNQDMYKDDSRYSPVDQMRMEKKLGEIEQTTSRIIARVINAYTTGKEKISLSRSDKDLLRKFQFVMKYRGPLFFRRFNHQTADAYTSNDRVQFLEYMRAKNFMRPLDVWFDNLMKIIDMPMDPNGDWIKKLKEIIYPPDAMWMFLNIRSMYLAFVTPSDSHEQFILTDNSFGIHEGPVSFSVNRSTGEQTMTAYTEYHLLNVLTPTLAMILRHYSMPDPIEDTDPGLRNQKMEMMADQARMHVDPENATSILQDLPLARARNSYTELKDGRRVLAEGADGKYRASDMFHFIFFKLESRHIQTINTIMLDQAHNITKLVFKSESALRMALEFYLTLPVHAKGDHSIKTITDRSDDPMLLLFRKLEHVARLLGSDITAVYHVEPLMNNSTANAREMFKQFGMGSADGVGREAARDTKSSSPSTENTRQVPSRAAMVASDHRRGKVAGFSRQGLHKAFEEIGRDI
jgi:hypothetical protein